MTPTALARACRVSTARITKTLDQLEGRGLVIEGGSVVLCDHSQVCGYGVCGDENVNTQS